MTAGLLVFSANAADGPAILIQAPSDRLAFGGEQVLLQAQADGTGPLQWQWLRNGAAIPGANQPTLMLPSVAAADDDTSFSVTVSNFLGTATSSNALLSVRPGILLSASANNSVAPTIRRGWPLLLEISLLHPDSFDSNAVPIAICASNGPWSGALSASIVDIARHPQTWPIHQQTVTNETLSLTADAGGRILWWLTAEETIQLPFGQFNLTVTLNTTNTIRTNEWKGTAQSPSVALTITNEPSTLTEADTEEKYRLFADYALLQGDRAQAQLEINALLAAYPTNIGGLTYNVYLKEAAGLFDEAFRSVEKALDQVGVQSPDATEPPSELLRKEAELEQIVAPPTLEHALINEHVVLNWSGYPGLNYRLETSSDLSAWSLLTTNFTTVSNRYSFTVDLTRARQFFRVAR